jgi:hypothetical protein
VAARLAASQEGLSSVSKSRTEVKYETEKEIEKHKEMGL